jgi:predicted nucleic acid-binding protein
VKVFVDTSAWAAYYDPSDRWHAAARDAIRRSVHARVTFVTTDYVLDETLTLLLMHAGRPAALQFGEAVQESPNVDLVYVDPDTWDRAWGMFRRYEDKVWAFTDCTSFTVMQQRGLYRAFSFDRHFEQAGFVLWPAIGGEQTAG